MKRKKYLIAFLAILISINFAAAAKYTNDLIYEESPYLRQHAHNPVNWLPWGKKAFQKAKKEHKPIFLSIGYSTCHWCHVMERESFENEEIAKLLNDYYVPVKVDREERPDLDRYYQTVFSVMHHRSGGWPLTIIMTEDKKPFFAATYIPPEDGYGVKGMKRILPALAKAYKNERAFIEKRAASIEKLVKQVMSQEYVPVHFDLGIATKALRQIQEEFDPIYGGFLKRIKFPQSSKLELLLDIYELDRNETALKMATKTLKKMAQGGIFDQIEGGFFRYTTDRAWTIPHFEKMLYTNAELIGVYTHAYKITKDPFFAQIVRRTIENVDERFAEEGLYYSASNAESEGEEGKYFLFGYDEALQWLVKNGYTNKEAKKELAALGIEEEGNFDTVLSNPVKVAEVKESTLELLKKLRSKRAYPFIDKKIITAWNAMYIKNKLTAFIIDPRYKEEALISLDRLLQELYKGRLYHQKIGSNPPAKVAFLEDYAYLIDALIEGYQVSLKKRYLYLAKKLYKEAKSRFYKDGRWYFSLKDHPLPARRDDSYYSSPYGVLVNAVLKLAALEYDLALYNEAKAQINKNSAPIFHEPALYPTLTIAALRLKAGDVVIKAKRELLLQKLASIKEIEYPFILDRDENLSGFEACTIQSCFATGSLQEVAKKILQKTRPKRSLWKTKSLLSQ